MNADRLDCVEIKKQSGFSDITGPITLFFLLKLTFLTENMNQVILCRSRFFVLFRFY